MSSILLFGVTGLVGSHLVFDLKKSYPDFSITVYLRNKNIDEYLTQSIGVNRIVHGTYDEHDKISSLSKEHDVVINVGSSWDNGLSEAITAGLKQRDGGKQTILIHMSGTGNFVEKKWNDGAHHEGAKIWNDDNPEDMKLISPEMLNGGPDTIVFEAGKISNIQTSIIFPPIIYGKSLGPVRALGVVQLLMQHKAKELGFIPYVGEGSSITNTLHVKDVSRFVLKVLAHSLSIQSIESKNSVYECTYIIGSQELTWKTVAHAFATALHAKGLLESPEAKSVKLEDAGEGEIPMLMASDMRFSTRRAQRLGFEVKEDSLIEFLAKGGDIFLS